MKKLMLALLFLGVIVGTGSYLNCVDVEIGDEDGIGIEIILDPEPEDELYQEPED